MQEQEDVTQHIPSPPTLTSITPTFSSPDMTVNLSNHFFSVPFSWILPILKVAALPEKYEPQFHLRGWCRLTRQPLCQLTHITGHSLTHDHHHNLIYRPWNILYIWSESQRGD